MKSAKQSSLPVTTRDTPSFKDFLAPRHWPTWLGIGMLWLIAHCPHRIKMAAGALLGRLTHALARDRRYITQVNIGLCFPQLSPVERDALVLKSFVSNGIGLVESVTGWFYPPEKFRDKVITHNLDALLDARAEGRGVLLLSAHYSTLDFCANLFSLFCPFAVTYRPHRNPLFDAFILRGRLKNCEAVIDRRDIRGAFRHLRSGKVLWYAPDQDYGPAHAVFAPFFGNQAATITTTARFAGANDSPVIMAWHHRIEGTDTYELHFTRVEHFPTGDEVHDATIINRLLEQGISRYPDQYLWMHKRFKTQPGGKPESPYIDIKTPRRKITQAELERMIEDSPALPCPDGVSHLADMGNGLKLALFKGRLPRFRRHRHPAMRLDRLAKNKRLQGLTSITADNIFSIKDADLTAITFHCPADFDPSPLFKDIQS